MEQEPTAKSQPPDLRPKT